MKIRIMAIGGINAAIAIGLMVSRGYSEIFIGYLAVSLGVVVIGLFMK